MNSQTRIPLYVWYFNDLLDEWVLKTTPHFKETKDEYNYFRVMSEGHKEFYSSAKDYVIRHKDTADFGNELTDVNGNVVWHTGMDTGTGTDTDSDTD